MRSEAAFDRKISLRFRSRSFASFPHHELLVRGASRAKANVVPRMCEILANEIMFTFALAFLLKWEMELLRRIYTT